MEYPNAHRGRDELLKDLGALSEGYSRPAAMFSDDERLILKRLIEEGLVEAGGDAFMCTGYWLKGTS